MNIVIGVRDSARELALELDMNATQLAKLVNEVVTQGLCLDLTDTKGQRVLIPATALAYVQIADKTDRRVGFAIN